MANGKESSTLSKFLTAGFLVSIATGTFWVGGLANEVEQLSESEKRAKEDHDTLIELKSEQGQIKDDVEEIKDDVKDIDDKLDDLLIEIRNRDGT